MELYSLGYIGSHLIHMPFQFVSVGAASMQVCECPLSVSANGTQQTEPQVLHLQGHMGGTETLSTVLDSFRLCSGDVPM
jgi:hypothetical protein